MARFIGFRHRVKQTAAGEAKPTQLSIREGGTERTIDLKTETDELDFVRGRLPKSWRKVSDTEDLSVFPPHHLSTRALKKDEKLADFPMTHLRKASPKEYVLVTHVPETYDGLAPGDTVGAVLGGSGDRFSFALSGRGTKLVPKAEVYRIPSFALKGLRGDTKKETDASLLANLVGSKRELFQLVTLRERDLILLGEAYMARIEAMKARMAAEQRLRSSLIGRIFTKPDGEYPEGDVEVMYETERTSDVIMQSIDAEEKKRERELVKIVSANEIFRELFLPIRGVGPMIGARLIIAAKDVRRFDHPDKLVRFMGAHVNPDGTFPRRRTGAVANWHPDARQGLFLLGDQFNRAPKEKPGVWGAMLRQYKATFRARHPDIECSACKVPYDQCVKKGATPSEGTETNGGKHTRRYTDAHIHKMATWRTLTRFVRWLWREWWKIEERHGATHPGKERFARYQAAQRAKSRLPQGSGEPDDRKQAAI